MKTIAIYSPKGGTGKSTICSLLTVSLIDMGFKIFVLDGDTQQCSSFEWGSHTNLTNVAFINEKLTKSDLKSLNEYDYVLIDCAPRFDEYNNNILELSDMILIPIEPSQYSISSLFQNHILTLFENLQKQGKIIKLILNKTKHYFTTKKISKEIQSILKENNIFKNSYIGELKERQAYVIDFDKPFFKSSNSKAKSELLSLTQDILKAL